MITHACLEACSSALCQANPEYVSVKCVSPSRSLVTYHSSAILPSMVMTFDSSNTEWCLRDSTLSSSDFTTAPWHVTVGFLGFILISLHGNWKEWRPYFVIVSLTFARFLRREQMPENLDFSFSETVYFPWLEKSHLIWSSIGFQRCFLKGSAGLL